jgi:hypothetical protein
VLHRVSRWWATIALTLALVVAVGIGQTVVGHTVLRKVGLIEEPTGYTSLAFLHPQSLPERLPAERASVATSFVIHNTGTASRDYRWSMHLVRSGQDRVVAAGSTRVAGRGEATILRSATISCTRGHVEIVVKLARPAEAIDALAACWTPRK